MTGIVSIENIKKNVDLYKSDEYICSILAIYDKLSIKDIIEKINYYFKKKFTFNAIKKSLELLISKDIILSLSSDDSKIKRVFSLNYEYINLNYDELFAMKKESLVDGFFKEKKFNQKLNFNNLVDVISFIDDFEYQAFLRDKTIKTIECEQNFNYFSLFQAKERLDKEFLNLVYYCVFKDNHLNSMDKQGYWLNKKAFIKAGVFLNSEIDTFVIGDYIVSIKYESSLLDDMRSIFSSFGKNYVSLAKKLKLLRGKIMVHVREDSELAQMVREEFQTKYSHTDFKDMISDFKYQKLRDLPLTKPAKYDYVFEEQIDLLLRSENQTELHDSDLASFSNAAVNTMNENLKDHLSKFSKGKSCAIYDLGVGPCVKPISMMPLLLEHYESFIEYFGVDFSQKVLDSAEKDFNKYNFQNVRYNSINPIDFADLVKNPELVDLSLASERLFLMTGATAGNYDKEYIKSVMASTLKQGDFFFIDIEYINSQEKLKSILPRYDSSTISDFNKLPFYALGFSDEELETNYTYNEKLKRIEGRVKLLNCGDTLPVPVKEIGFEVGDEILTFFSRKPTEEEFKAEMYEIAKSVNGDVELSFYLHEPSLTITAFGYVK